MQWAGGGNWCIDQWLPLTHITILAEHNYGLVTLTMILLFGKSFIDFIARNVRSFPRRLRIKYLENFPLEHERRKYLTEEDFLRQIEEAGWQMYKYMNAFRIQSCLLLSTIGSTWISLVLFGKKERLWHSTVFQYIASQIKVVKRLNDQRTATGQRDTDWYIGQVPRIQIFIW